MKIHRLLRKALYLSVLLLTVQAAFANDKIAKPNQLVAPKPIEDSTGRYLSPYTSDMVLADWVDMAVSAKIGSSIGSLVGTELARQALDSFLLTGALLGSTIGEEIGRSAAIEAAGGEEFMRESSDLSFNTVDELALYLYVKCSSHEHYKDALEATIAIYPDLGDRYYNSILRASREAFSFQIDLSD